MKGKAHVVERIPVASEVAQGKYALGFQQVSELLPVAGVTFIGELPENVQYITRFAGAVTAKAEHRREGKALLDFLASSRAQLTIRATGMRTVPRSSRSGRVILFSNQLFQLGGDERLHAAAASDEAYGAFHHRIDQRHRRQHRMF